MQIVHWEWEARFLISFFNDSDNTCENYHVNENIKDNSYACCSKSSY